ncbi:MAG: glycosyltransferase family 9 protein [Verrucomicrobiia bacterium]
MRKVILKSFLSPGDIVMLTAAVRDLHLSHPKQFLTDVSTPCPHLWENNPYLTRLEEKDSSTQLLECQYPLIHRSNTEPWHFIHGFTQFISEKLGVPIRPGPFKGDIHLSPAEKGWMSQVQEITKEPVPFWIVVAGGKRDFTIKWWQHARFQKVVDHFRKKILFVQVGEKGHEHPPLKGTLDLRGKTDLRQLVRLVYHAQGVLSPVTLMMHLAAAVETKPGMPKNRPCVVVAGGREPAQWEAYPHHQYIHTNGALRCCDNGGCWKSRGVPLGDGDEKDKPENICVDMVIAGNGCQPPAKKALEYPREQWPQLLPHCMDLISVEEVIRRIKLYFHGGAVRYLTTTEADICQKTIPTLTIP